MPEPFLSIVVPAYNEARRIRDTLEKLSHIQESKPNSVELIVVDDGRLAQTQFLGVCDVPEGHFPRQTPNGRSARWVGRVPLTTV